MNPYHYTKVDQPVLPPVLVPKNFQGEIPSSFPELPSLDEPGASGQVPENTTFPMTESPPPGYITDDGDAVSSPGSNISSNGECFVLRENILPEYPLKQNASWHPIGNLLKRIRAS